MRVLLACVVASLGLLGVAADDYVTGANARAEFQLINKWAQFKKQYGKLYETEELEQYRFGVFARNQELIAQYQAENPEATFGFNKFADMDPAEFKRTMLNYKPQFGQAAVDRLNVPVEEPVIQFPTASDVDWRKQGAVTDVKDQGNCGSCWAFSATEQVESSWYLKHGILNTLSPQQVVSCDTAGFDAGCDGGDTVTAFDYIQSSGLMTEASFPYKSGSTGTDGTCKFNSTSVVARISGYTYATPSCFDSCAKQDEATLLSNLASSGPVSICVYADSWQFYTGGVLSSSCPSAYNTLDHCVQLVGYASATQAWIIRNSWGTSWGEDGYINVKYGKNLCGVADEATFVTSA